MPFPIIVSTLGGKTFRVRGKDNWVVWDLKCALDKPTGTPPHLQHLSNDEGVLLLDERPLLDFCSLSVDEVHITLVRIPKTTTEIEWLDKWHTVVPEWLRSFTREVKDGFELQDIVVNVPNDELAGNFLAWARCSKPSAPTEVLMSEDSMPAAQPRVVITTGKEVLVMLKKATRGKSCRGKRHLSNITINRSQEVTFRWSQRQRDHFAIERVATLNAVLDAVLEKPELVFESPFVDEYDLRELALAALSRNPDIFYSLPHHLREHQDVLFATLAVDADLRSEFLRTADQKELRQWREHQWAKN